jgi:hypothetical protein
MITQTMHQLTCSKHGIVLVHDDPTDQPEGVEVRCPFCDDPPKYDGEVQVKFYKTKPRLELGDFSAPEVNSMAEFKCEDEHRIFYATRWNGACCPYCDLAADFCGTIYVTITTGEIDCTEDCDHCKTDKDTCEIRLPRV